MKYSFEATALSIFQHPSGEWFIKFHAWVSICVGPDKPAIEPGDRIRITLEKGT